MKDMKNFSLNEKEALYVVSYSDYECYSPTILRGPVVRDWNEFCSSLIDEVTELAIMIRTKGNDSNYGYKNEFNWHVGTVEFIDCLVDVLLKHGYEKVSLPEFGVGQLPDVDKISSVRLHNLKTEIEINKKRTEKAKEEKDAKREVYWQRKLDKKEHQLNRILRAMKNK